MACQVGAFRIQTNIVFQMGVIFNFSDELEEVLPGKKITFDKLDFIADRFGDLCLQECELTKEGQQSL